MVTSPTSSTRRSPWTDRPLLTLCLLGLLLAVLTLLAVSLGPVRIPLRELLGFLGGEDIPQSSRNILRHVRLPRAAAAVLTGAALAVSGAVLRAGETDGGHGQDLLWNCPPRFPAFY